LEQFDLNKREKLSLLIREKDGNNKNFIFSFYLNSGNNQPDDNYSSILNLLHFVNYLFKTKYLRDKYKYISSNIYYF